MKEADKGVPGVAGQGLVRKETNHGGLCAYSRCRKPLPTQQGAGRPSRYCPGTRCKDRAARARRREQPREPVRESTWLQRVQEHRAALEVAWAREEEARRQLLIASSMREQAETRLKLARIEAGAEADLLEELREEEEGVFSL